MNLFITVWVIIGICIFFITDLILWCNYRVNFEINQELEILFRALYYRANPVFGFPYRQPVLNIM